MVSTKRTLQRALNEEAGHCKGVSPLAIRLLSDNELDWVSGAEISYAQSGTSGSYNTGTGNGSFNQSGGTFNQSGDGSFAQDSGTASMHPPKAVDGS